MNALRTDTQEHYDIIAAFEKDLSKDGEFRGRFDKEDREMWRRGHVYQQGETNALFFAYLRGYSLGKAVHQ